MSNTPYTTTDTLSTSYGVNPIVGQSGNTVGFYGATGATQPSTTGATAGTDPVAASISAALKSLGLIS